MSDSLRTPRQVLFRARQELINLRLIALPPAPHIDGDFVPGLQLPAPPPGGGTPKVAGLGSTTDSGSGIRWRRDYKRGIETDLRYFRRIPFLNTARAGDHKVVWELNRHQHLVILAQTYLLTGDPSNLDEIWAQLESWMTQNPFHRGINWVSALEVAFRALSWMWIDHLVGTKMPVGLRDRWLHILYLHGCHLANNLSFYYSPNNHLVGEALALHALGLYFSGLPRAGRWAQVGAGVMREQMDRQIREDGSSFEQSTYYQVYLLDMFSLHAALANPGPRYCAKLQQMAEFVHAMRGPSGRLPHLGDDDGGCLSCFHSGPSVGAGNWESRMFPDSGLAVMACGDTQAIVDAGPFGALNAGHSHSDTLSMVLRAGKQDILIDPGTYTYTGDPEWRDWFRSTRAHNTVCIDGRDQAVARGPFRWVGKPQVAILEWRTSEETDVLEAECRYAGFVHRRRVEFRKPQMFLITDDISGPAGPHQVEQLWHLGSAEARAKLSVEQDAELTESWRSPRFGEKHLGPMLRVRRRAELPLRLEARIDVRR